MTKEVGRDSGMMMSRGMWVARDRMVGKLADFCRVGQQPLGVWIDYIEVMMRTFPFCGLSY